MAGDQSDEKRGILSQRKQYHVCKIMVLLWMEFYGWEILFISPAHGLIFEMKWMGGAFKSQVIIGLA